MKVRDIPKHILVGNETYDIVFKKTVDGDDTVFGSCDSGEKEIVIKIGLNPIDRAETLIHEIMHALEFEYNLDIPHALIHKLERPIRKLITDNWRLKS